MDLAQLPRLFLHNLALQARLGIHAFERAPQRVLVSVDLYLDPASLPKRDRIAEAVDYDAVRSDIVALAASRHFKLQETFVHAILDVCLARPGVIAARASSAKPDIYPDVEQAGYEAVRFKTPTASPNGPMQRGAQRD
jgi:dihydroneopterin aldolase